MRGQLASEPGLAPDKNVSGSVLNAQWGEWERSEHAESGTRVVDCFSKVQVQPYTALALVLSLIW